jgi:TPR repeat protein
MLPRPRSLADRGTCRVYLRHPSGVDQECRRSRKNGLAPCGASHSVRDWLPWPAARLRLAMTTQPERDRVMAAAKTGNAEAQNELGDRYLRGAGVDRDAAKAADWYRKAADQGYAPAQSMLGVLYLRGNGVPKDPAQALHWVRKAADQGNADAQSDLGIMYLQGLGPQQDDAQAVLWLRRAADSARRPGSTALPISIRRDAPASRKTRPRPCSGMPGQPCRSSAERESRGPSGAVPESQGERGVVCRDGHARRVWPA